MRAVVVFCIVAAVLVVAQGGAQITNPCFSGSAKGFVAIQDSPAYLVGTVPSVFTDNPVYFSRRYNCTGGSAQVRRIDLGLYEVRFPGLRGELAVTSAVSQEGVTASAYPSRDGIIRIALRGPLSSNDVAQRRDVPFSVVVF